MRTVPDREACWSELGVRHRSSNRSNAGRTWSSSPSPKAVMPHLARASMKQHLAVVLLQLLDGTGYTLRRSPQPDGRIARSEEYTSELQSLMRISYAVFCLKKKHTRTP